jgi:hypothetical protein
VDLGVAAGEVVGQVRDDMGGPRLNGEAEVVGGQHFPVEAKADLHHFTPIPAVRPPSMRKSEPVMNPALSEAR